MQLHDYLIWSCYMIVEMLNKILKTNFNIKKYTATTKATISKHAITFLIIISLLCLCTHYRPQVLHNYFQACTFLIKFL
mgnify:CR=1 FL=1